jgi:hypothetical protein
MSGAAALTRQPQMLLLACAGLKFINDHINQVTVNGALATMHELGVRRADCSSTHLLLGYRPAASRQVVGRLEAAQTSGQPRGMQMRAVAKHDMNTAGARSRALVRCLKLSKITRLGD